MWWRLVASRVRRAFWATGADHGALVAILGVSERRARRVWRGSLPLTIDELALVAEALGVEVLALVPGGGKVRR